LRKSKVGDPLPSSSSSWNLIRVTLINGICERDRVIPYVSRSVQFSSVESININLGLWWWWRQSEGTNGATTKAAAAESRKEEEQGRRWQRIMDIKSITSFSLMAATIWPTNGTN
jgi:hypothetical protein